MKTAILLLCALGAVSYSDAGALRVRRQLVPREFQNINIENYLKNERAVAFQLKCIVYDGPCDRIGKYLKITIPELLTNQCRNCDPEQRMRAGRLVAHIQQNFPKEWEDAVKKFQGGQVKPEDAQKLETLLGVKLDPKLVGTDGATASEATPTSTAAAPAKPEAEALSVSSTPVVITSTTSTTVAPPPSTAAPEVSSSTAAAVVPSSAEPKSEVVQPAAAEAAPEAAPVPTTPEAPVSSSSVAPPPASSETPVVSSSEAPKVTEAPSTAAPAETKA